MADTLLDLTQEILLECKLDPAGSVNEFEEAEVIAQIIRREYRRLSVEYNLGTSKRLINLESLNNSAYPNYLKIPDDISRFDYNTIYYDVRQVGETQTKETEICYIDRDQFIHELNIRNNDDSNVIVVSDPETGVTLKVVNDKAPTYYTILGDKYVVFDSYDSAIDTTLQQSKNRVLVEQRQELAFDDNALINFAPEVYELLKHRATIKCKIHYEVPVDNEERRDLRVASQKVHSNSSRRKHPRHRPKVF